MRAAFTKSANEIDKLISEKAAIRMVQVVWEVLLQKHEAILVADRDIYDTLLQNDISEEDLIAETESCDGYLKKFIALRLTYEDYRRSQENTSEEDNRSGIGTCMIATGMRKFKLPTIEFKKFGGDIRDWLSFWGQFKKINDDPDIDAADKFQYLNQATIPNSRARQLVESFPPIAENYEKVIESLQSRFGREDLQIEVYVRELLKLVLNNAMSRNKMGLSVLYDKLETQLRALETLGIKNDNCSAMLFPLIESCLPEDLLRVWQRSSNFRFSEENGVDSSTKGRLDGLMKFLKAEVENEERISLAAEGFGFRPGGDYHKKIDRKKTDETILPTAAGLMNCEVAKCIFCQGSHESENCFKAQRFSLEQRMKICSDKKACFRCLRIGHQARKCRQRLKCVLCGKPHVALMCTELSSRNDSSHCKSSESDEKEVDLAPIQQSLANHTGTHVFLQTLRVKMISEHGVRVVRVIIDTGSQRSYVLKSTAENIGYTPKRTERISHSLFGGANTTEQIHNCFDIKLNEGNYSCTFEVLDQPLICGGISHVFDGCWMEELKSKNIQINDVYNSAPIEVLIGADVAGKLYTGRRHILKCGLVAVETLLGWTLMGKMPNTVRSSSVAISALSLFVRNATVADLWELDILGISEPAEKQSREELEIAAKELFLQTITVEEDGRYKVRMPWLEGHPPLPENYVLAKKRLSSTLKKLENEGLYESYNEVFNEWLCEGIIEEVTSDKVSKGVHYLPHRPVVKESSLTTKIRPVFDASAREKDKPSLNSCIEKGPNLIELIPSVMHKFRKEKIGVISDIKKAFLQISLDEADRDFLRFLWTDTDGNEKVYRHRRVVFGVSCSPFLLGATIEYHLSECLKRCAELGSLYSEETVRKLQESFYLDNCVTSVYDENSLRKFISESSTLMSEAKFDLRGWECTQYNGVDKLLNLEWHQ